MQVRLIIDDNTTYDNVCFIFINELYLIVQTITPDENDDGHIIISFDRNGYTEEEAINQIETVWNDVQMLTSSIRNPLPS